MKDPLVSLDGFLLGAVPIAVLTCILFWFSKVKAPKQIIVCGIFLIIAFAGKWSQFYLWIPQIIRFHAADLFVFAGIGFVDYFLLRRFRSYGKSYVAPDEIKARLILYIIFFAVIFSVIELFPELVGNRAGSCDPVDLLCYLVGAITGIVLILFIPEKELKFRMESQVPETHSMVTY